MLQLFVKLKFEDFGIKNSSKLKLEDSEPNPHAILDFARYFSSKSAIFLHICMHFSSVLTSGGGVAI